MKKYFLFVIVVALFACNSQEHKRPNTAMDVGRDFIRSTLDGDFVVAETLLIKDTQNVQIFDRYKNYYKNFDAAQKQGYKKASYEINNFNELNDSTVIIDYSNSFMHQSQKIRLIKKDAIWAVDFKYTSGDTTSVK